MAILTIAWTAWTVLLAIPVLVFAMEVLAASCRRSPRTEGAFTGPEPANTVLVPAHNEESGIAPTLRAISQGLRTGDRILVVADNCSDNTAGVARQEGATVVERSDATKKGKGYALDFGIQQLRANPPDVVTIIDADCSIDPGSLRSLCQSAMATGRPVQALYLMHAPPELGFRGRVAEFAWVVKNHVRPLGLDRLGLPCQLMGTGMAFPWHSISGAQLASGHLVEDMQLGAELAAAGTPPLFLAAATVHSHFAVNAEGASSQRTRWEHGHLQMITVYVPRLLWKALRSADWRLFGLTLDLGVPPLALLTTLSLLTVVANALLAAFTDAPTAPLWISLASMLALAFAVLLAWSRFGRRVLSASDLFMTPVYALRKLPLYLRFFTARQSGWVRSRRDDDRPD